MTVERGTGSLRCTTQTAELGESPHGTAGGARRYVLVELPLPWPKPIGLHPLLDFLGETPVMTSDYRLLAILGPDTKPGEHRVITYEAESETSLSYTGYEVTTTTEGLAETVISRLLGPPEDRGGDQRLAPGVTDVAICTQGTHDRCCGLFGTELYLAMVADSGANVRPWRTSHTGGHRFAPTAAVFPSGQMWANLNRDALSNIIDRVDDGTGAVSMLRGSMALPHRAAQVADAAAFGQFGWEWIDGPRRLVSLESVPTKHDQVVAVLESSAPARTVTVVLEEGASVPVPKCGEPLSAATKATPGFAVVSLKAETIDG